MYLHIGNHKNVRTRQIVGIFDLDTASSSAITRSFIKRKEKEGKTVFAAEEIPKSFVLTDGGTVLFSQISSKRLLGRTEAFSENENDEI